MGDAAQPRLLGELVGDRVSGQRGGLAGGRDLLAGGVAGRAEPLTGFGPGAAELLAGGTGCIACGPERIGAGLRFVARRHRHATIVARRVRASR